MLYSCARVADLLIHFVSVNSQTPKIENFITYIISMKNYTKTECPSQFATVMS